MDIPLYQKFLQKNLAQESRLMHLDPGTAYRPQSSPDALTGKDGLILQQGADMMAAAADPTGSWTGVPLDPYETPEQDADDL